MSLLNKITFIVLGGAVVGAIFTGVALYVVLVLAGAFPEEALRKAIFYGTIIGLSFLIPVYMIRVLVERLILSKVKHMTDVIMRIADGEVDAKVEIESDDELGRMAEAFERMRRSLKLLMKKVEGR